MYANHPEIAKRWSRKYADGGLVQGPLNMADGGIVGPVPTANPIPPVQNETVGYGAMSYGQPLMMADGGQVRRSDPYGRYQQRVSESGALSTALDFIPIIGDIKGGWELIQELRKDPINWAIVGMLTAGLVVGLVPGVGDAAAAGIKRAARSGDLALTDLKGILRAARDGDVEFLKGWQSPSSTQGVGADVNPLIKKGGRPKKSRTVYMQTPDGEIITLQGDEAVQSIADATGLSKKTVQNRIAEGKPIHSDNYSWVSPKAGENRPPEMLFDVEDARKTTVGRIIGPDGKPFEGSLSDLLEEIGTDDVIDWGEGLGEFDIERSYDGIRKRMKQGHDFKGYRFTDAPTDPYEKQKAFQAGAKERGAATKVANINKRIDLLGLDSSNEELVKEFSDIWNSPKGGRNAVLTGKDKLPLRSRYDEVLKETNSISEALEARDELANEILRNKDANSPRMVRWKRFFKKWKPELIEGMNAEEARRTIAKFLEGGYLKFQ